MLLLTLFLLAAGDAAIEPATTPPVGASICIACRGEITRPQALYSDLEWKQLRKGGVLRSADRQEATAARTRAAVLIEQPPARVWAVLTDFESWPGFMPHVTKTEITRRDGERMWVRQDFKVMLVGMRHTTVYDLEPKSGQLAWNLDLEQEHDIAASAGHWELVPIDEGRRTLVRYEAAMDSGRGMPAFVEDLLLKRSLADLVESLRAEVTRRESEAAAE